MDGLLGVAGMIITSDEMDHSRKFNTVLSTSKLTKLIPQFSGPPIPTPYPLVNIQKTMENHHVSWENPL